MEPHPFGSSSSSILAQKITHKGLLGENIWLLGTVVRVRQKFPGEESAKGKGLCGGKSTPKGKPWERGKGGAKDTPKPTTQNYEMYSRRFFFFEHHTSMASPQCTRNDSRPRAWIPKSYPMQCFSANKIVFCREPLRRVKFKIQHQGRGEDFSFW